MFTTSSTTFDLATHLVATLAAVKDFPNVAYHVVHDNATPVFLG